MAFHRLLPVQAMDVELLSIGNELLLGQTVNTNAAEIALALGSVGAVVARATTVADDTESIRDALRVALARSGFVITTGGLGPTRDDITKMAVADLFEVPLVRDHHYLEMLRSRFEQMGHGPMPVSNQTQADLPEGASALPNPLGTAPGLWMEGTIGTVVMLPGVPKEMRGLLANEVIPRVKQRAGDLVIQSKTLRTAGISESALADSLDGVEEQIAPLTLAYLPSAEAGVDLRITAWRLPSNEAHERLASAVAVLEPMLGRNQYHGASVAEDLLSALRRNGLTVAIAESCTGGLVSHRLTEVPGCSDVFVGGIVAYANDVKKNLLGVQAEVIERHGAVSGEAAQAMVLGVQQRFGSDTAIAVTGVAGPSGGTPEKPVGTVHIAARIADSTIHRAMVLPGDREDIRQRSALRALDLLRRTLR